MAASRRGWSRPLAGLLALLAIVVVAYLLGDREPQRVADPAPQSVPGADDLPVEVSQTLALIDDGGPFPDERDGATFENREDLLPDRPLGYYQEYTVPTPGEDDRGPRRLVVGEDGEVYYTADHYASFVRIRGP